MENYKEIAKAIEEGKQFEFYERDLPKIMEMFKPCSEMMHNTPTEELCQIYRDLFPLQTEEAIEPYFLFSMDHLEKLNLRVINNTLKSLVDKGIADYFWSEEENDFVFRLKK